MTKAERLYSVADVRRMLYDETESEGGVRAWSEARGIEPTLVSIFLAGGSPPQPVLAALNLVAIVRYRRITKREPTVTQPTPTAT